MRTSLICAALAATTLGFGAPAQADSPVTHEVTIFDNDFMPPVVLATPGDQIVFYNTDEWSHQIDAIDASWTTGIISADGSATVLVTNGHTQEYQLDDTLFPLEDAVDETEEDVTEAGLIFEEAEGNADEGEVTFEDG